VVILEIPGIETYIEGVLLMALTTDRRRRVAEDADLAVLRDKLYRAQLDAVRTPDGCLIWPYARNAEGYGRVWEPVYGDWLAHRAAYFAYHGELHHHEVIHHRCGNRSCFELDHLAPATASANAAEMLARRHYEGELARRDDEIEELEAIVAQQEELVAQLRQERDELLESIDALMAMVVRLTDYGPGEEE
jgi:uncharacterized coiled-coil protein SlyX